MDSITLEVKNLTKAYPGTVALDNFSTVMDGGKVYALLGKNGSGKSTFVKCISGAIQPTRGEILLDNRPVHFRTPMDAFNQGIAVVYQELSLILDLSVAENILMGRYSKKGIGKLVIDWEATNHREAELLASLNIDISVHEPVRNLSVGQRQMIEIAKAMSYNPKVLILDEPTSALAQAEVESLFSVIRKSKEKGVIVIFITHKLNEIRGVSDYVTVLRDSHYIDTIPIADASPKRIVELMFGDVKQLARPENLRVFANVTLEVRNLTRKNKFENVSFKLHKGEILGIAGMLGSGRTELLRAIFGADPIDSGEILVNEKPVRAVSIREMKRLGVAMTSENRKEEGLVQMLSIRDNLCFASMERIASFGYLTRKMQKPIVDKWVKNLEIKISDSDNEVSSLSGGNQQKIVVGNWLNTEPGVIFFDEPSRGIDVQAKQQIFQIMWELSWMGLSVIFVSTELEELLEVCHRLLIMKNGKIEQEALPEKVGLDELYALCMEN